MKKKIRKKIIALCMITTMLLSLCSCSVGGRESGEEDSATPKLVIGIDNYEPFSFIGENGLYQGIDIELAKEACKRMGYQAKFVKLNWEKRDKELSKGKVDCLWSCYTMNGREEKYNWAGPYMNSHHVVMVRKDSSIKTLSDVNGKIVAVQVGTTPESLFLNKSNHLPRVKNLVTFKTIDELISALRKGYVDAIAAHEAVLHQYTKEESKQYRFLSEYISSAKLGVAFKKGDDHKTEDKMTKAIKQMVQDGTVSKIVKKYGMNGKMAVKDLY